MGYPFNPFAPVAIATGAWWAFVAQMAILYWVTVATGS